MDQDTFMITVDGDDLIVAHLMRSAKSNFHFTKISGEEAAYIYHALTGNEILKGENE